MHQLQNLTGADFDVVDTIGRRTVEPAIGRD